MAIIWTIATILMALNTKQKNYISCKVTTIKKSDAPEILIVIPCIKQADPKAAQYNEYNAVPCPIYSFQKNVHGLPPVIHIGNNSTF